ncbi:hypothetical protein ACFX19_004730 [Malus domestica]
MKMERDRVPFYYEQDETIGQLSCFPRDPQPYIELLVYTRGVNYGLFVETVTVFILPSSQPSTKTIKNVHN